MPGTWTCTEDEDHGSLGDNLVRVINGTSGSPATFADFVTADRAGEAVLLGATSCAKDMTLTYQVRPCELRALKISFIIASKTAETDYLWITGTDFRDNALSECIDISAGNGTYVSNQYFRTITDIDVEDVGDGSGTAAADGTLRVTQPQWGFIWDQGGGVYKIDATLFRIGDDSTATHFTSKKELVTFADASEYRIYSNATRQLGGLSGDWGINGSVWSSGATSEHIVSGTNDSSTDLIYASVLINRGNQKMAWKSTATVDARNSMFLADNAGAEWVNNSCTSGSFKRCYFSNGKQLSFSNFVPTIEDCHIHAMQSGIKTNFASATTVTADNLKITDSVVNDLILSGAFAGTFVVKDPVHPLGTIQIQNPLNIGEESYTCNIAVADKDGTLLDGAEVLCEDDADAQEWTTTTGDTDTGKIDEQIINAKQWTTTSETLDDNNPFKFTISKSGYETLILENITVDGPIDWHLELQSQKQPVAAWQEGMM